MTNEKNFINNAEEIIPSKNDTPYKRILAIGDCHGCYDKLMSLWGKISVREDDLVIFLGDYIDRGDKVAETLMWIMEQSKKKNRIFLRGNHEQMMLNAFCKKNKEDQLDWIDSGGKVTLEALNELNAKKICSISKVINFVKSLPLSYLIEINGRKYFFCHAGIDINLPLKEQKSKALLWSREKFFNNYKGKAVIISGHSPVQYYFDSFQPIKVPGRNVILTDTGSSDDKGTISCVDVITGQFWQSDSGIMSQTIESIIFVCYGNTCRSPMAKYIMRKLLAEKGLSDKVIVDSAGCNTRGGGGMSKDALEILKINKIPYDQHISKRFTKKEYGKFKYVIALDKDMLRIAKERSKGDPEDKILLFKDFEGHKINVDDPFHTGNYKKAFEDIYLGCSALLESLL